MTWHCRRAGGREGAAPPDRPPSAAGSPSKPLPKAKGLTLLSALHHLSLSSCSQNLFSSGLVVGNHQNIPESTWPRV